MHGYPYRRAFRPSGHYGDGEQIAIDAFKTGAAASVAGGAAVASTLAITAAGVATVPVAGWVAGAVLGTAAGIAALVVAIKSGKARRKDAVALAKKLKLPQAAATPKVSRCPGYCAEIDPSKTTVSRYTCGLAQVSTRQVTSTLPKGAASPTVGRNASPPVSAALNRKAP